MPAHNILKDQRVNIYIYTFMKTHMTEKDTIHMYIYIYIFMKTCMYVHATVYYPYVSSEVDPNPILATS